MGKKYSCSLCGRNDFTSNESVIQHIKTQHVGRLSEGSIEYLLSQGVSPEKLIQFCKENKIKVDESKVYKIAVRMVKEGKI